MSKKFDLKFFIDEAAFSKYIVSMTQESCSTMAWQVHTTLCNKDKYMQDLSKGEQNGF
jgi:hypothetical protein